MFKRLAVLILAVAVAGLLYYGRSSAEMTPKILIVGGIAVAAALAYAARGSLPDAAHRYLNIHREDDPENFSPRLYLPILLAAIALAVALFLWFRPR